LINPRSDIASYLFKFDETSQESFARKVKEEIQKEPTFFYLITNA